LYNQAERAHLTRLPFRNPVKKYPFPSSTELSIKIKTVPEKNEKNLSENYFKIG
jgi:hypothetical protein